MLVGDLFMIAQNWKQPVRPLGGAWINKLGYVHTVGIFTQEEQTTLTSTCMKLRNIALNKRSQTPKS